MKKDDEKEAFTVCRENVNINANKVKNIQKSKKKNQSKLSSLDCEESCNLLNKYILI